jgi:hypothetical protein
MDFYKENSVVKNGADTNTVAIGFQSEIVVGKFVDKTRPTYLEARNDMLEKKLGDKYRRYGE